MTHGEKEGKIFSSSGEFIVNELWENFTGDSCKTLAGKPKLFFIQACRGSMTDPGAVFKPKPRVRRHLLSDTVDSKRQDQVPYVIPVMADLLIFYSTSEGFYSFRNPLDGSWFIQGEKNEIYEI